MRRRLMKLTVAVMMVMALSACCLIGGQIDRPELDLRVAAKWGGEILPAGSSATVDFYQMDEAVGIWNVLELDVLYPEEGGAPVDTFAYEWQVPLTGEHVTYRYEVDVTVGGVTYTAEEYPELACESGEWWWIFAGSVFCEERER